MKIKMTNETASVMVNYMNSLSYTGMLGYALARNIKILTDASAEYMQMKADVFKKYGEEREEDGKILRRVDAGILEKELGEIARVTHDIDVFGIKPELLIDAGLNNQEMSRLIWMVEEILHA